MAVVVGEGQQDAGRVGDAGVGRRRRLSGRLHVVFVRVRVGRVEARTPTRGGGAGGAVGTATTLASATNMAALAPLARGGSHSRFIVALLDVRNT